MHSDVPNQVKPYLDEIAHRLWSNNAVVMVGAGFSQNAKSVNPTSNSFPSWKELGDKFYEKLHGHTPSGDDGKYLNLLKLAEQVEAAFGRPALNDLLRHVIPDLSYEPSPLHSQLLSLPWKDVFTTNYDTLLERARVSVTLKHYEVVVAKEDLLYANNPRIVKLHGSFPSSFLIITEEDYRTYPNDYAPFVNTVRQSLLENTLCLIGFSGDDPNFLRWIGWMRDHLGKKTSPKIYLIGVFNSLSEVDKKLLDGRGIVTVDLTNLNTDPGTELDEFLKYLECRKSRAANWPTISVDVRSWAMEATSEKYADITVEWRRQRTKYPGWVVMPEDRRRDLWLYTERWLTHLSQISRTDRAGLETPLDLDLAFELAWRLDQCLFPLIGELPAFLEEVAKKYSNATLQLPENSGWTETSVFEAIANIRLWLLRHYREEGLNEKWKGIRRAIEVDDERLLPEHRAKFQLEEALQALFCFDPAEAKRLLVNWRSKEYLPFWEAKRAALMAELGETTAAFSILETSLSTIRQQLGLNPVTEDYTLVSQESVVMLMLWTLERGMALENLELEDRNILDELSDRWNELIRFKCDPRREIASLSARFRHPSVGQRQQSKTHSFDLGIVSTTYKFGFDEDVVATYGLLRMYEDIGMPYRIESATFVKASVESTLPCLRLYSPHWALVNITRLGDTKVTDGMFNREYLDGLGRDEVDRFFEIYLPAFERTISVVNEPDLSEARNFEMLAKTLPEVFSRLCYKCSTVYRKRLVGTLRDIYESKRRQMFANVGVFANRLFDSMSVEERVQAVPLLIDFPVPNHLDELEERNFINPIRLVNLPETVRGDAIFVKQEQIDELFDRLAHTALDRDRALTSLVWLHNQIKLNEQQSERLGAALWACVENSGVPVVPGYYSFAYMTMPHPGEIDPEPRVKQHLWTMISERMGDSRRDDVLDELRSSAGVVKWSEAEAIELVQELSEWWYNNRHWLHNHTPIPFGSPRDRTMRTSAKAVQALSAVFSHLPTDTEYDVEIDSLREFLADLATHNIPTMALEAATLNIVVESPDEVIDRVTLAMLGNNHDVVVDALSAARVLMRTLSEEDLHCKIALVVNRLLQGIQWRHRPALAYRLRIVADLVDKQPQFLSSEVEAANCLLDGLEQIAEETSTGVRGNDQDGVIAIRAAAASLAFSLCGYYQESGSDEPETIRRWREICSDPDEFSEIKNSWIDIEG